MAIEKYNLIALFKKLWVEKSEYEWDFERVMMAIAGYNNKFVEPVNGT